MRMRSLPLAVAFAVAIASVCVTQPENLSRRTLTFAQRVSYQRSIEEVCWRHRIWPKDNPQQKPPLAAIVSEAQLERKVEDYLRKSQLVTDQWQSPITASALQAEMERMAAHTKQPEVLRELFEALGNDPFVIAECLVRPAVAERLVTRLSCNDRDQFHTSRASAENQMAKLIAAASPNYKLPTMSGAPNGCTDDTWTATSTTNAPSPRDEHTAVWTGTEMIVWGGSNSPDVLNTGGRYTPSTDTWTATSTINAPDARIDHTAVWTGTEMIVWGGNGYCPTYFNTGGRYNPATDSWTATSTANAPDGRLIHTAVWTGSQMIVWGGQGPLPRPAFLTPAGDTIPAPTVGQPPASPTRPWPEGYHTAVWTGQPNDRLGRRQWRQHLFQHRREI